MTIEISNPDVIADRCQELATLVMRHTEFNGNGIHSTAIKQLDLTRSDTVSTALHSVYQPILALVVQGQKEALLGEKRYQYGAGQYLIISVDLPLSGFVIEATPEKPYLGLKLNLDLMQLCDLVVQMSPRLNKKENSVQGLSVSNVDAGLIECALRLVKLLDTPQHISMLAPIMICELNYRLLIGKQSEAVRQIATSGSNMQRIASAIKLLKAKFTQPIRIEDLASHVSMSTSSFHQHFKRVTSMSPLQYQKQLRLLEARRLMLAENVDAMSAAYQVGYESSSQFSREYARMFGAPPIRDIERLRTAGSVAKTE
ncbi:transcriptional Regulator, AraC family [Crocosphaera subtropica ATCC 51142]|uniref:Transcriptional Regulator, AraC family n=1 Tax=Crocosphaera subtropica (strain ATCC 51142 / BH68) TaxID=43989 RepID=B1X2S3_CROS5|nr:AraC family transcriptional regulator [Crocosphaera subtropica]ACB54434.1 transcriptional Regulator, AraC family [Crocosphaera subtropica ATCC 51142]